MSIILYSNDLKNEVEEITKRKINDISDDDLAGIKQLSLNKKGYFGEKDKDYNIFDLCNFPNLEIITLCGFKFNKDDIIILNSLPKIKFMHFDFCDFDSNDFNLNTNVENIIINHCKNLNLKSCDFTNAKFLKFISSKNEKKIVDIEDFKINNYLKELSINNCRINNIEKVLQLAPNIINLNLDGSEILDGEKLDSLKIRISHEKEFYRFDS